MDAHRFLTLADQLLTGVRDSVPSTAGDGAPECRCATSRAYYAAYNVAVEFLGRIGFETTNSHNCHHAVQFAFNQSGNASLRTVSANLNSLHSERKVADYEMRNTLSDTYPHANSIVELARTPIGMIDAVASDTSLWGEIATAVLNYIDMSKTTALRRKSGSK